MKVASAVLVLLLLVTVSFGGVASQEADEPWEPCELPEYFLPDPAEYNITDPTNYTWGYNPWMPQYTGGTPTKTTFLFLTGGCLPVEEGGSASTVDAARGWRDTCEAMGIECQCRPLVASRDWNPPLPDFIYSEGFHFSSWEIRRALDEHRRGLIKLGGISAKASLRNPEIYNEARDLGVPVFVIDMNAPRPGEPDYGRPEPDGYIATDQEFLGRTMARVLKQLRPGGAIYGFIMAWESPTALRRRHGFNDEMTALPTDEDEGEKAVWKEVERYPYERPYNLSVDCDHMSCQMDGLAANASIDALIYLYQTPINNPNYTSWVDRHRYLKLTHIGVDALDLQDYLNTGYVDGMVGQISYEWGKRSAEVLLEVATKLANKEISLPLKDNYFETSLLSYSVIPRELDKVQPPELDQNLLGNLVYAGYAFVAIIYATALFCAVWTVYNRSTIIVRAAQPFFLLILLSGIVIFSSTIIPLSFDDGGDPDSMSHKFAVGVCMSQPWLAFTGFSVIFSALFSKTWRVNKLFHTATTHARIQVALGDVVAPFAVIFTSNVIVLTCWTVLDPLTYTRLMGDATDFWNRQIESYGACRSDHAVAFLIPLAVINFMVLGIACWQAFEARNIVSEFSESKFIALSVASLFQAFLIGFPVVALVRDDPKAFNMVLTLVIFVLSEGILLLIFLPKLLLAYTYSGMTLAEQRKEMSAQIRNSATGSSLTGKHKAPDQGSKYFRSTMFPGTNVIKAIPEQSENENNVLGMRYATVEGGNQGTSNESPQSPTDHEGSFHVGPDGDSSTAPTVTTSSKNSTSGTSSSLLKSDEMSNLPPVPPPMPAISSEVRSTASSFIVSTAESEAKILDETGDTTSSPAHQAAPGETKPISITTESEQTYNC